MIWQVDVLISNYPGYQNFSGHKMKITKVTLQTTAGNFSTDSSVYYIWN